MLVALWVHLVLISVENLWNMVLWFYLPIRVWRDICSRWSVIVKFSLLVRLDISVLFGMVCCFCCEQVAQDLAVASAPLLESTLFYSWITFRAFLVWHVETRFPLNFLWLWRCESCLRILVHLGAGKHWVSRVLDERFSNIRRTVLCSRWDYSTYFSLGVLSRPYFGI